MPNPVDTQIVNVDFFVNDQPVHAAVESGLCLLRYLREEMGLTGPKDGCSTGHCGACTIIMDGKATRACLVKMSRMAGRRVETIEGLAKNGVLHPLQRAFVEKGAVQCGFCTPGMIMCAKALLDANPNPSLDDVKKALSQNRNLCRCTGYIKIFEAIQLAAEWMRAGVKGPEGDQASAYEEGRALKESTAVAMVTGQNKFTADLVIPNMLFGKVLWAEYPYARIKGIDTSEAEAMPGVACVITAKDIPGKNQAGIVIRDQVAIAGDLVRYIGDGVAAVFAESRDKAEEALSMIKVDYEVLQGVFTPEESAAPGAPIIQAKGNKLHECELVRGDVEEAFSKCAVIVEQDYNTPAIEHGFIEPEAGLGYVDVDGTVVIKYPTQTAFDDRAQLSEILAMPEEKIRVIQIPAGGAFGGKEDMVLQQYLALGALKSGRPVKMVLTREESLRVHQKRHPAWMHYKTGADKDGHVLAVKLRVTLDTGIYCSLGIDILENTVVFGAGPYYVPNVDIHGWSWYTNNVLSGAMRGFGVNQIAFGLEQQMDAMARALNIDPFEFRLINGLDVGLPTAADHIMEKGVVSIKETVEAARDAFKKQVIPAGNGKKIGVGVASAVKNIGFGHNIPEDAGAVVELTSDGKVFVKASQHEYGQGAIMGLTKLATLALGAAPEDITVTLPDTAVTPVTGPTTASRQTVVTGNALVMACTALKEELFARAGDHMGINPEQLMLKGSKVVDKETGEGVELSELGRKFVMEKRFFSPQTDQMLPVGEGSHFGKPDFKSLATHFQYTYNTQVAIVEVDETTGEVKVLKIISANDVGKVLNEDAILGQIHGGVMMGLGFALSEQFLTEKGYNTTDTLHKVGLPQADMTPEIEAVVVEVPHPAGPLGVKGFAEAPSLATAPAIMNAIYDATGVRITALPANKKRVLAAIQEKNDLHYVKKP